MASKHIISEINSILDRYSQHMDLVEGPYFRGEISKFVEANRELQDNDFITAANGQFGGIIDLELRKRTLAAIGTIKTVVVLFLAIPVAAWIVYIIVKIVQS